MLLLLLRTSKQLPHASVVVVVVVVVQCTALARTARGIGYALCTIDNVDSEPAWACMPSHWRCLLKGSAAVCL